MLHYRTDVVLVEKINRFLSLALKCALSNQESGSVTSAVDFDSIQDFVKDMNCKPTTCQPGDN